MTAVTAAAAFGANFLPPPPKKFLVVVGRGQKMSSVKAALDAKLSGRELGS